MSSNGITLAMSITETGLFKEIIRFIEELDERYPEADISRRVAEIANKYAH